MDLRTRIAEALENGTTAEWAAALTLKYLIEATISAVITSILIAPVSLAVAFVPRVSDLIGIVAGLTTAGGDELLELAAVAVVWIALFGFLFKGTLCNYP